MLSQTNTLTHHLPPPISSSIPPPNFSIPPPIHKGINPSSTSVGSVNEASTTNNSSQSWNPLYKPPISQNSQQSYQSLQNSSSPINISSITQSNKEILSKFFFAFVSIIFWKWFRYCSKSQKWSKDVNFPKMDMPKNIMVITSIIIYRYSSKFINAATNSSTDWIIRTFSIWNYSKYVHTTTNAISKSNKFNFEQI